MSKRINSVVSHICHEIEGFDANKYNYFNYKEYTNKCKNIIIGRNDRIDLYTYTM